MKIYFGDIMQYLRENKVLCQVKGNTEISLSRFCPLNGLRDHCMTWAREPEYLHPKELGHYDGLCIVCTAFKTWKNFNGITFLFTEDPFRVYFSILDFYNQQKDKTGNHVGKTSVIKTTEIGKNVRIGEYCYLDDDVIIGDDVTIKNNVSIECPAQIGKGTIIGSGAVIGEAGFGYFTDIDGNRKRVPHIGGVQIGENTHIGENVCISRGCLGNTVIGNHVRIDNLTHIAHNVIIGDGAYIICNVSLCGSCEIGENAWISPGASIKNQAKIGRDAIVGLGAVVIHNIPEGSVVAGIPAEVIRMRKVGEEI